MAGHFKISRHALQIDVPLRDDGDIDCANAEGERIFPQIDYSKGFPDWWHLDRTDIKVPSEHTQHGKRYAAEVVLSHFYEVAHYKNQIGYVSIFMQDYPDEKPWHYLDKLICQWRREEEKTRAECGLPPAPVYKMCELYRGQERSPDDFEFFEETPTEGDPNNPPQLERPNPIPIQNFGANPDDSSFPLQLCEGDCDFSQDCAPGLICHRRDAFGAVPGCIGGETDPGDSDYCVFDPFGSGYSDPTASPTVSPTTTARPTVPQLAPKPVVDFGGTPPLTAFPLQRCEGDCDFDTECAEGLICFQRGIGEAVPGCLGAEADPQITDYCILDPFGSDYVDPDGTNSSIPSAVASGVPSSSPIGTQPPTMVPTVFAAIPDTQAPTSISVVETPTAVAGPVGPPKPVWNRGWEPFMLLDNCEGDCDDDSDCLPGLKCFSREGVGEAVPGCFGGEEDNTLTDYCYLPDSTVNPDGTTTTTNAPSTTTTQSPTTAETLSPTTLATNAPTVLSDGTGAEPVALTSLGWSPPEDQKPLSACQGDCDDDSDCLPGLICFQRFLPNDAVPGCTGGELDSSLMDYCIVSPTSTLPNIDAEDTSTPVEVTLVPAPVSSPDVTLAPSTPAAPAASPSAPVASATTAPAIADEPPPIDCDTYRTEVNLARICKAEEDMCCQEPRSSSNYCHGVYSILGDDVASACHHCCLEGERGEALKVGPPNVVREDLEPYEECDTLENTSRMCKDGSCCDEAFADTDYCQDQFDFIGIENVQRMCWYCCYPSKDFSPLRRRELSGSNSGTPPAPLVAVEDIVDLPMHTAWTMAEMRQFHKHNPREIGSDDVMFHDDASGRKVIVRAENFREKGSSDEEAYFKEIHGAFQRRELQTSIQENYEDVFWWPYEWLLKVGTEYYFRYEGSMTVPPCYTVNHWRVLKDPIRVANHQIKELERLLAWRVNSDCDASTAGRPREDDPDAVDVNRPLQELEKGHRLVFCECQDWPSKFPQEREWCAKWQERDPEIRLFENPYNWAQAGF